MLFVNRINQLALVLNAKTRLFFKASFLFVLCIFISTFLAACAEKSQPKSFLLTGPTMGTRYHITVVSPPSQLNEVKLQKEIDKLLININQQMSTYIADSEISNFNRWPINNWQTISADFFKVVELSQSISLLSEGRFDITIGPLVDLWGFGAGSSDTQKIPDEKLIEQAKSRVGWQYLVLDKDKLAIQKLKPVSIDLSAIAKGYGVDKVSALLDLNGIKNYLVEIGGEVKVKGLNKEGNLWRLGIETPSLLQQGAQKIVQLEDQAIATSGDYRNYFEEEGVRFSHTIDPITGRSVKHNIASVSVIATTAAEADALATALNAMGFDKAQALTNRENIAAYFILYDNVQNETNYRIWASNSFNSLVNAELSN